MVPGIVFKPKKQIDFQILEHIFKRVFLTNTAMFITRVIYHPAPWFVVKLVSRLLSSCSIRIRDCGRYLTKIAGLYIGTYVL